MDSDWIGSTFTSDVGWNHLKQLVDIGNRMAGSDGERRAAEVTRETLTEIGAREARLVEFDIQGWTRETSRLETGSGSGSGPVPGSESTAHDCIALPHSPADTVTGELVDLGYGLPEDFAETDCEGCVVLASSTVPDWYDRFIHRREKYYRAIEAGAVAFVFRNHIDGCLPPTGSIGTDKSQTGELPAVGVSKEVGHRLKRRFEGEEVTVAVDAQISEATSQNVHAELGPDTDEVILVTSHIDAHDISEGAMDNAAGTGVLVEIANALTHREDELDTRVEFVSFGAEEVGLVGSEYHATRIDHDRIKAVVNNDGVMQGRTLRTNTHGFDGLADAVEAVSDRFDHPITIDPRLGPHSDHWSYTKWGVPGCYVHSDTGPDRGWGHTHADTLDKLESRTLREQAILVTELVVELADSDRTVSHKTPDEIATALEDEDLAAGMKLTGDWPY